jgi:hypothetical protein
VITEAIEPFAVNRDLAARVALYLALISPDYAVAL